MQMVQRAWCGILSDRLIQQCVVNDASSHVPAFSEATWHLSAHHSLKLILYLLDPTDPR
jgi:hypothetical protein